MNVTNKAELERWRAILRTQYEPWVPPNEALKTKIIDLLQSELRENNIPFHAVVGRVKSFESCYRTIMRTRERRFARVRMEFEAYLSLLTDLCGVRVVCLYVSQLKAIEDVILSTFDRMNVDRKSEQIPRDRFGYSSNHYDVTLRRDSTTYGLEEFVGRVCEIQVRTVAMDAWASISRDLSYHRSTGIPDELQRDFYAVSALMHIADNEFENYRQALNQYRPQMRGKAGQTGDLRRARLNDRTLSAVLADKYKNLPAASPESLSRLLEVMKRARYRTVGKLLRALAPLERQESGTALHLSEPTWLDCRASDRETMLTVRFIDDQVIALDSDLRSVDNEYLKWSYYALEERFYEDWAQGKYPDDELSD